MGQRREDGALSDCFECAEGSAEDETEDAWEDSSEEAQAGIVVTVGRADMGRRK